MIAIAWLILIAAIAVIIWFCAAAIAGLQYVAQGVVSDEVVAVLVPFAGGTLYILVVRSIGGYFRKKAKNKESGKVTVSIKVFDGRFVEFLDEGLVKVRKIERVCFSKDYLFFLIDGGARFIYLPRGLIADDAFKKIGIWAAEIHL